jgi:hypothetical protein
MQREQSEIESARLIRQGVLPDGVEMRMGRRALIFRSAVRPRAGWARAAKELRERNRDRLLDPVTPTRFDKAQWRW